MTLSYRQWPRDQRRRGAAVKHCIFCPSDADLTKEHFFPEWLHPYLDASYNFTTHYVKTKDKIVDAGAHYGTGPIWNRNLKIVCSSCNSGWMSRLQTAAKLLLLSMIEGEFRPYSVDEQTIIARWTAMFTMVTEFADVESITFSQKKRQEFASDAMLADRWHIWLAPFNQQHHKELQFDHLYGHRLQLGYVAGLGTIWTWQTTAITIGRLLLLSATDDFPSGDEMSILNYKQVDSEFGLLRVFPAQSSNPDFKGMILPREKFYDVSHFVGRRRGSKPFQIVNGLPRL